MTNIAFYHLQRSTLEQALPKLLEKTLDGDNRALVVTGSEARSEFLNGLLWTYDQDSWLPHGSIRDEHAERQPVLISESPENVNQAGYLFLTDGCTHPDPGAFERCFDLFDGRDDEAVKQARDRWKQYLADGHELTYWQQNEQGRWEQKN